MAYPKRHCTEHTSTSLWKRKGYNHTGRQGRAGTAIPHCWTEEAGNVLGPRRRCRKNKRHRRAGLLLKAVLTFKRPERDPGSECFPALAPPGSTYGGRAMVSWLHYRSSVCTEHWVTHFFSDLRGKDWASHHYKWSIFFSKKCPLFLQNSPPHLCHRLVGEQGLKNKNKNKNTQLNHNLLIRENQNLKWGITCQTSWQSWKAAFVHQG